MSTANTFSKRLFGMHCTSGGEERLDRSEPDPERKQFWISCVTSMSVHVSVACLLILVVFPEEQFKKPLEIISRPAVEEQVVQIEYVEIPAHLDIETEQSGSSAVGQALETADAQVVTVSATLENVRQSAAELLDVVDVDLHKAMNPAIPNGLFGGRGGGGDGVDGFGVAFYGLKAFGKKFVFVADCSDSMAGDRLEALKKELHTSVENLDPQARFSIVFFNHLPVIKKGSKLDRATPSAKKAYLDWADTIGHSGSTEPSGAVEHALKLKPTSVFLMTDGTFDPKPTISAIEKHGPLGSVRFYSIAVGRGASTDALKKIAEMTGGDFRQVD